MAFTAPQRQGRQPVHAAVLQRMHAISRAPQHYGLAEDGGGERPALFQVLAPGGDIPCVANVAHRATAPSEFALRPPPTKASAPREFVIITRAISALRRTRAAAPSCSAFESLTTAWLRSMSSALQPRECAMNGNCGNWQPISPKKVSICPTTACTLSWPPVTM